MDIGKIYKITNKITEECYIGKTKNSLEERLRTHKQKHSNCKKLKEAFLKYGIDNFNIEILEDNIPFKELDLKETYYIQIYKSIEFGYNIKEGNSKHKGRDFHIISDNIKENVITSYIKGMPTDIIAFQQGICITSVYNILKNTEKIQNKGWFNAGRAKINFEELKALKQQGYGTSYLAKYFNVSKSSVKRMVNRHKDIIFPRVPNDLTDNAEVKNVL